MQAEKLIQTLEKLLQLHQNLHKITLQKTESLKSENVEQIKELLKKEQMFLQAIKQIEAERIQETITFLGSEGDLTLSACIEKAKGEQKESLKVIAKEFKETMDKLKEANLLNRELTQQALQFVSISLDMLMPQESFTNYQRPDQNQTQTEKRRRSLFDSQV
ncbi:flagellar protein FlgN [Metabacillus sediminilitoris]|uniref:Flagellar protein FlgN n=1 Tax=Metabacillus sediminilitoris TaxID=2567941 RepID=A0A4S4C1F9_9BACI|nr:flagellar protein FlgN [Metabacillus sediminilitoris]QGQ48146.1 flagellar protein FlgN [Metabacillus sediminilitoris]THF81491.1 flagellar protein FlgN [Metabacillus sediminilitoris]